MSTSCSEQKPFILLSPPPPSTDHMNFFPSQTYRFTYVRREFSPHCSRIETCPRQQCNARCNSCTFVFWVTSARHTCYKCRTFLNMNYCDVKVKFSDFIWIKKFLKMLILVLKSCTFGLSAQWEVITNVH